MSVTSISRDTNNNVSIARMTSNDTIATITGTDYIANQQNNINALNMGPWQWFITDFIACRASDGNVILTFTDSTFSTVQQYGGSGGMFLPLAGGTMSGVIDMGTHKITNVVDPSSAQDAATKNYVDTAVSGSVTATQVQQGQFNLGVDSGIADAYNVALTPSAVSLTGGMLLAFKPLHSNLTTNPTVTVDGHNAAIFLPNTNNVAPGDLNQSYMSFLQYDGNNGYFVLMNPISSWVNAGNVQYNVYSSAQDGGAVNAIIFNNPYVVQSTTQPGQVIWITWAANTNTGATTISNGIWTENVVLPGNVALSGGEIIQYQPYFFVFSNVYGAFVLMNPSVLPGSVTATQVQQLAFNTGVESGIADAYIVTLSPVPSSYTNGMIVVFNPTQPNVTSIPTLQLNALSPLLITLQDGTGLSPHDLNDAIANAVCQYSANTNTWILLNPIVSFVSLNQSITNYFTYTADSGAANNYIGNVNGLSAAGLTYLPSGLLVLLDSVIQSNTGPSTFTDAATAIAGNIMNIDGSALAAGAMIAGGSYLLLSSNSGHYVLINSSLSSGGGVTPIQIQQQAFTYAVDSGAADAYIAAFTPPYAALVDGMRVSVRISNTNLTTTPTLTVDGLTTTVIVGKSGVAVAPGDLLINVAYDFQYNSALSAYQLI